MQEREGPGKEQKQNYSTLQMRTQTNLYRFNTFPLASWIW